jgi:hypothetical protein
MAYIPYYLMDSLLGANVTARQALKLIVPVLVDAGLTDVCEPLIEFLTIALVQPNATCSTPITVQTQVGVGNYIPSPAVISFRRQSIMYRDLPGLRPAMSSGPGDPAMLDIARSVRDFLLLLCQVYDDEDLPPLYHEWSARTRGVSERWVLQQAAEAACAALSEPSFEVTPTQAMAFKIFRFAGSAYFDIGTGLLPFSITLEDGISPQARTMLAADRVGADAFDLGADPESGAVAPGDVIRLRNMSGY